MQEFINHTFKSPPKSFSGNLFEECLFDGCDLSKCDLSDAKLLDCHFKDCKLCLVRIEMTGLQKVQFKGCKLQGINFSRSSLAGSTFHKTNLTRASFIDAEHYCIDPLTNTLKKARFSLSHALVLLQSFGIIIE